MELHNKNMRKIKLSDDDVLKIRIKEIIKALQENFVISVNGIVIDKIE